MARGVSMSAAVSRRRCTAHLIVPATFPVWQPTGANRRSLPVTLTGPPSWHRAGSRGWRHPAVKGTRRSFLTAFAETIFRTRLERWGLCQPGGPEGEGQARGQARSARGEPPQQTRRLSGGRGRLLWRLRWLITVSEFGFWVALGQPVTEGSKDGQASHENGDAREDLKTAMCGLGASVAGGRQKENETERIQAVIEPVSVVLPDREHERRGGKQVNRPDGQRGDRHGYHGDDPDRGADRLFPYPLPLADEDIEKQEDNRLRNPVGLGPSQGHADRPGATEREAEHDRHADGNREGDALAFDHLGSLETARQHDAIERGYGGNGTVGRCVFRRRRRNRKRRGEGKHQQ